MAGTSISLTQVLSLPDVLMMDRFRLDFSSVPSGGQTNALDLAIRCQQCVIPGRQIEPIEVNLNGHTVHYRGRGRYPGIMMVSYVEFRDMAATRMLRGWQEAVVGTDTGDGLSKNANNVVSTTSVLGAGYARNARLAIHNENGTEAASFTIVNCWPTDVQDVQLDGMTSQAVLLNATFQYDYIIPYQNGLWTVQNVSTLNQIINSISSVIGSI